MQTYIKPYLNNDHTRAERKDDFVALLLPGKVHQHGRGYFHAFLKARSTCQKYPAFHNFLFLPLQTNLLMHRQASKY